MALTPYDLLKPLIDDVWARADIWYRARGDDPNNYIPGMTIINARTEACRIVCGEHGWTLEDFEDEDLRRWRNSKQSNQTTRQR